MPPNEASTRIRDYIKNLLNERFKPKTDEEEKAAAISKAQAWLPPSWKVVGVEQTDEEKKAGIIRCDVIIPAGSFLLETFKFDGLEDLTEDEAEAVANEELATNIAHEPPPPSEE